MYACGLHLHRSPLHIRCAPACLTPSLCLSLSLQRILSRIQNARPGFDNAKLDEEAIDHARLVESITEYHSRPIGGSYRDMPGAGGRSRRARSEGATGGRRERGEVDSVAGGASMYQDSYMGGQAPGQAQGGYAPQQQQQQQMQMQGGYPGQPMAIAYPMGAYALAPGYGRPGGYPMGAQASPMGSIAPLSYGGVTGAAAYPIPTYASMGAPMVLSPGAGGGGGGQYSMGGQGQGRPM